ncbi:hypothetical protein EHN06_20035 [Marinobacter sp. NP-4(2019)]|uniref:VOC family protein n=1 Tax=Marinobacter sp. NP-4(2019) TaxID=2488665 RepID=UPI000FC3F2F9|nr:VOC family protein [Marinobacter sp. NP-4(2019)]AZT85655.1 hypothetical protein EHN06_20035 [Marinobacter sp. NP-4(2019)]
MKSIKTSLMFVGKQAGKAEEAIKFYTSLFPGSEIIDLQRYEAGEHEKAFRALAEGGSELMPLDNSSHGCRSAPLLELFYCHQ